MQQATCIHTIAKAEGVEVAVATSCCTETSETECHPVNLPLQFVFRQSWPCFIFTAAHVLQTVSMRI